MTRREFNAALRDADRTLADASSRPELDLRIWRRLQERQARPRWRRLAPRLVLASAIGVVAAIVFVVVRGSSHPPAIQPIAVHEVVRPRLGGFVAVDGTPDLQVTVGPERTIEVTAGRVTLLDEARGVAIQVATHARVRGERDGVRVVGGTVDVRVDKRPTSAPPARILVSHGVIEVLGTEFRIEQAGDQGRVSLREGAIRFVAADGRVVTLAPGDALTWPLPSLAPPPASIETATPAKPPTKAVPIVPPSVVAPPRTAAVDPESLLREIAVLRSRGHYEAAVQALTSALAEDLRAPTRERLSFELGAILSRRLADPARACAHWSRHRTQFPSGRYDEEILQTHVQLGCPSP